MVCGNPDEDRSLSPEHCTVTPNVKADNFNRIVFFLPSASPAEDKRMFRISARKRFFAEANKMCCIAAQKSSELFGIANTEAGKPAVWPLAFAQLCRSRYRDIKRTAVTLVSSTPNGARLNSRSAMG